MLVDQQTFIFINSVLTAGVVLGTYQKQWTLVMDSERDLKESVLLTGLHNDDEFNLQTIKYI